MTATPTVTTTSSVISNRNLLDPRIFSVIDEIDDFETYQRIVNNITSTLEARDVLLIASKLNLHYPPTDVYDVADCLSDGAFSVVWNSITHRFEWESTSTRQAEALEWVEGKNAFGYRPPDRILVEALRFDGTHIQFIENPTEEMKLTAVARTSAAIRYIRSPSDAVMREAADRASDETDERSDIRAAFASTYGPGVAPADGLINGGTLCRTRIGCGLNAIQHKPEYWVQGIGPLNLFSDLVLCTVMELNSQIGNNIESADFVHVSEIDGELMLSFSSMQQLFSMRDVFRDLVALRGLEGTREMHFDGMEVIAYPSSAGTGFIITWGPAAAVSEE